MGTRTLRLKFRIIFFILTCLAILGVDLAIVIINKYILSYRGQMGKHQITIAGIAGVLVIFYIFVSRFNRVSEWAVNKFVHVTRVYLGREIGLWISIAVLSLLLYAGYYWAWFDINFFDEIRRSLIRLLS